MHVASAGRTTVAEPDRPPIPGWWTCRIVGSDGAARWFAAIASDEHEPGTHRDLSEAEGDRLRAQAVSFATYDAAGDVRAIEVRPKVGSDLPPLWLAELTEPDGTPPAVSLIAFTGHGIAPHALLTRAELRATPVRNADQLAAVRWYPGTGEVDQVYVSPDQRRRGLGSAMIVAAGTLAHARDWPTLWGDGQRTGLGDRMVQAAPWGLRAAPLSHLAPPMTPRDQR